MDHILQNSILLVHKYILTRVRQIVKILGNIFRTLDICEFNFYLH